MKKIKYKLYKNYTAFSLKNPFLDDNIHLLVDSINKNVEIINIKTIIKSKRKRILVTMKCECGNTFTKVLDHINRENRNLECKECYIKNRAIKKMKRLSKERIKFIESLGYEILSDVKYFKNTDMLKLKNKDGYIGYSTYASLKKGSDMTIFSMNVNKDNFIYNANIYCKNNGLKTRVIGFSDNQKWTRQGIKCQCECGEYFETSIATFTSAHKHRCDKCSIKLSKWCKKVEDFLNINNISFTKEFIFNDCRDILPLPFDYYIDINNGLIEVDGEQHFGEKYYTFGKTKEQRKLGFEKLCLHDKIKNEYCKKNNIKLLRISYKNIEDGSFENKIMQFIKE